VPDWPAPGVQFRDITPLLQDPKVFRVLIDAFVHRYMDRALRPDIVAGVESRGFILAAAMAERRGKGFVPIRKKGKLPPPVIDVAYDLEYGSGVLEMQTGQGRLLLIDDVLATGGTLDASVVLCGRAGYVVQAIGVLLDIGLVPGFRCGQFTPRSVIRYG